MNFRRTIYKRSRSALSDMKHEAIAECFGSDKVRTASFVNVLQNGPLYTLIPNGSMAICFLRRKILRKIGGKFHDKVTCVCITCTDATRL